MPKSKSAPSKFNPANLTNEEQEAVVEYYLGYHPRYFIYEGGFQIKVNVGMIQNDRRAGKDIKMEGFKKHLEELGRKVAV